MAYTPNLNPEPVSLTDGADVAQGAKADAAWTSGSGSVIALLKALIAKIPGFGTAGSASTNVATVQGIAGGTPQPVSGTFFQATQPVSAAALPLPSGAATAAKQPALGTAGTPSADVLSVQGAASGTPLNVLRAEGYTPVNIGAVTSTGAILVSGDAVAYSYAQLQVTINAGDTLNFETSLDNATFLACALKPVGGGAAVTTTASTGLWVGPIGRYFRVNKPSGSNPITAFLLVKQTPATAL